MFLLHLASCLASCRAWDAQYDSGYGAWHADNDGTWTEENMHSWAGTQGTWCCVAGCRLHM